MYVLVTLVYRIVVVNKQPELMNNSMNDIRSSYIQVEIMTRKKHCTYKLRNEACLLLILC